MIHWIEETFAKESYSVEKIEQGSRRLVFLLHVVTHEEAPKNKQVTSPR